MIRRYRPTPAAGFAEKRTFNAELSRASEASIGSSAELDRVADQKTGQFIDRVAAYFNSLLERFHSVRRHSPFFDESVDAFTIPFRCCTPCSPRRETL